MSLFEKLQEIGQRGLQVGSSLSTEESTKTSLVMPFITALGYDIHNPLEVIPEYTADFSTKKGEKVDFAIKLENSISMIVECKKFGSKLDDYAGQLYRYFSVTEARIGILTDGVIYKFYSDLVEPNKLDGEPFYVLDLSNVQESVIKDLSKITKSSFDLDGMIAKALDLKYIREIKDILQSEFDEPTWLAMELVANSSYKGRRNQRVLEWFSRLIKLAVKRIENDHLRSVLALSASDEDEDVLENESDSDDEPKDTGIETTMEEVEGFHYIKSLSAKVIAPERVFMRDTRSYCTILIDNNNRKPLCKLHFNNLKNKSISIGRSSERFPIKYVSDILEYSERIRAEALIYTDNYQTPSTPKEELEELDNSVDIDPKDIQLIEDDIIELSSDDLIELIEET